MTKREVTRQHLYDTALRLFVEQGYAATTMRDIARAAGMGTGSAYYHFPSKESFVVAFYEQLHTEHEPFIRELVGSTEDVGDRLVAYARWKLARLEPARPLLRAVASAVLDPSGTLSPFSKDTQWIRDTDLDNYRRLLGPELAPDAAARTVQLTWMAWMALVFGYLFLDHANPRARAERMAEAGFRLLATLLAASGTPLGAPLWSAIESLFDTWENA
jgi:AcrR family transcriptional regulator